MLSQRPRTIRTDTVNQLDTTTQNSLVKLEKGERDKDEISLRPTTLDTYVGQEKIKQNLSVAIKAAKLRGEAIDHVLFYGPPGLGKTTLANIVAGEMGARIVTTSGPAIEKPGELAAILNGLSDKDVLFIDEIHRIPKVVEEVLYPAMEDHAIDIMIGKGPEARSIRLNLPVFTLVGATTRAGMLSAPLRDRFGIVEHMQYYTEDELTEIVINTFFHFGYDISAESASVIASRSRGTPRIAIRLSKRVRDFAEVMYHGSLGMDSVEQILDDLHIQPDGLDETDMEVLNLIHRSFADGPVGIETLSASLGEDVGTIQETIEPYLLQEGYLIRTPRGRCLTQKAIERLTG